MELDIIFNIDYPTKEAVGPFYTDIPKYIEWVELKTVDNLRMLLNYLKDDIKCFLWAHPSLSATLIKNGYESNIIKDTVPELSALGLEVTLITRSTGKTSDQPYFYVGKMHDIKKNKKSYKALELKKILQPLKKEISQNNERRPRVEESLKKDIQNINNRFNDLKEFLHNKNSSENIYWYENLFDSDITIEFFKIPYWQFKIEIFKTYLGFDEKKSALLEENILNVPEGIKFNIETKQWQIDFSFYDEVSNRFESKGIADYRNKLEIATTLYILHEIIHKAHNLDTITVKGIGNFPKIVEEADYQADTIAMLMELAYYINYSSGINNVLSSDLIKKLCEIIQIAIETTFSFNPIKQELSLVQVRRANRYLIWVYHYVKVSELNISDQNSPQLLNSILKQFSVKPSIEISGPQIISNSELNRTFYNLKAINHIEELALLRIDNLIIRMGATENIKFSNFYEGLAESNFDKMVDFIRAILSTYKNIQG